jgi:nucleotide-binding universal stress UspA family protein
MIEEVLFGSGRHLFLMPDKKRTEKVGFESMIVGWNGSRESTRALAEAMGYLHKARSVEIAMVGEPDILEPDSVQTGELMSHLEHHGISADLHRVKNRNGAVGEALISVARRRKADAIVVGGYGHSRLREWLLGGVTRELLRKSPIPLIIAH